MAGAMRIDMESSLRLFIEKHFGRDGCWRARRPLTCAFPAIHNLDHRLSGRQSNHLIAKADKARSAEAARDYLLGHCFGEDRLAVLRLQVPVGKAQNLKTAGVTDDPEIQLVPFPVSSRNFDKARQTSLLFDGSIDAR
jgi:hypothetical protein